MKRRVVALLTGALATLVVSVPPAGGATPPSGARAPTAAAGATAPVIPADVMTATPAPGASLGAGGGFGLTLDSGTSSRQTLVVANHSSDRRLTVRIEPVDGTRSANGNHFSDKATSGGTGSWVTASIGKVVLEPGTSANVPLTINVPDTAAAGDAAIAGLHVSAERADSTSGAPPVVDHLPAQTLPIAMTIAGQPASQLTITAVQAQQRGGNSVLAVTLHNAGGLAAQAVGSVQASGNQLQRSVKVTVAPREDKKILIDWPLVDGTNGADVDIELAYGSGKTASWIGNVAAPAGANSPATTADGATANPAKSSGGNRARHLLTLGLSIIVVLLMLGAGVWLVLELVRGGRRAPLQRMPIDISSLGPLQITMDPAHTQVLNALVTQVGVLAKVIEHLADRIGVTVTLPPSPPLLTPQSRRRLRGHRRVQTTDEPVVIVDETVTTADEPVVMAPAEPVERVVPQPEPAPPPEHQAPPAPVTPLAPPAPAPSAPLSFEPVTASRAEHNDITAAAQSLAQPVVQETHASLIQETHASTREHYDIAAAAQSLAQSPPPPLPVFIPPPPVDDEAWPTDAQVEAFLSQRRQRGEV